MQRGRPNAAKPANQLPHKPHRPPALVIPTHSAAQHSRHGTHPASRPTHTHKPHNSHTHIGVSHQLGRPAGQESTQTHIRPLDELRAGGPAAYPPSSLPPCPSLWSPTAPPPTHSLRQERETTLGLIKRPRGVVPSTNRQTLPLPILSPTKGPLSIHKMDWMDGSRSQIDRNG